MGMPLDETLATYKYYVSELDKMNLAYIQLVRFADKVSVVDWLSILVIWSDACPFLLVARPRDQRQEARNRSRCLRVLRSSHQERQDSLEL